MERVCVIGAGSSGITACQVLASRGIEFDCFERGSGVGGNWRFENDNGMSAAYRSLHINTSRRQMEYAAYPMPSEYPDYPHHAQIARYFDDFVDHFGLRERISFRTTVEEVKPADGGGWDVSTDDGQTRRYGSVIVANGHHWNPRWPEPPFPGDFDGVEMHAHDYRSPEACEGRNVLVLGIGNSATDIAVETSRVSRMTYLAMRRGAYIIPKYVKGQPTDELGSEVLSRLPLSVLRFFYGRMIRTAAGEPTDYGLPEPDHKLAEAHPTVSSELLPRIGHGGIKVKPNIEGLEGKRVRFVDGSVEDIDVIIYCTGYVIAFPFLDDEVVSVADNRVALYRRVVHPELEGLYFVGLIQPLGAVMPIAEEQSKWVADLISRRAALPDRKRMYEVIAREDARMAKRYVASKRHTIQVDHLPYMRTLARERRRGRRRASGLLARRSHELRVGVS